MQDRIEKAYFFSKKEFLLLLGIAGIQEIYSFQLPGSEEVTSEELIYTLYQLMKKGLIQMEEDGLKLSAELASLMEIFREGGQVLSAIPGRTSSQMIFYFASQGIGAAEACPEKGGLRVGLISAGDVWERLTGEETMEQPLLETEEEGQSLEQHNKGIQKDRETLEKLVLPSLKEPLLSCMDQELVTAAWELFDLKERKPLERFLFLKGCLYPWILKQNEDGQIVTPDSQNQREKLREQIICGRETK